MLRPHQTLEELVVAGEDEGAWFAAMLDGEVVGTAGVIAEPAPDGRPGWRVRAMAVRGDLRSRGIGVALLRACLAAAHGQGARLVWCAARAPAVEFYRRHGFVMAGEPYEEPGIGPHVTMVLSS